MPSQDLDNLSQRIKVEIRQLSFSGLNQLNPEFEILVSITNTSVFSIRLDGHVGYIQFAASNWEPKFEPTTLLHGESKRISLRQTVTDKAAEFLAEQAEAGNTVNFVCSQCRLVFKVATKGYEDSEARIPLKEGGLSCSPKGTVVIFDGNIGRVTS